MSQIIAAKPGQDLQALMDQTDPGSIIRLPAGTWRQKLTLRTPGLTLIGAGAEQSRIVYDDYALKIDEHGREYNTFRTWTISVTADGVTMRNLSVINDAHFPEIKGQEVALTVYGDRFLMENCILHSTQDTLFLGPLPADLIERYQGFLPDELRRNKSCSQHFLNCLIEGTVDFIFGCGKALFEDCEIRSLVEKRGIGYVAAPAHAPDNNEGFVFRRCRFTCEPGVPDGSVYLARPWRDYGMARFSGCTYAAHISAAGFDPWQDSGRDKTARFYESPAQPGRVVWVNLHTEA